ncbi:Na+/H+ antiporter NhaA [Methylobacterium sp. WSM2598]|uniref:Na+/H+ antiporter NhaA n=1 Tax=Methylobacterium sp. WSM2598 TaxID=398261 RepID=UPI000363209A|nr:Na+/H+ antiporter NhaA [Methylobacterium sp. WSM2598]
MTAQRPPRRFPRPLSALRSLLSSSAGGGVALMGSALLALVVANGPLGEAYAHGLHAEVGPLSLLHWINDGLMAVFFLLVGLEIKREFLDGGLRTWPDRALPGIAALGGMIAPALVYAALNWHTPATLRGWAIPAATDIAFALGVLALLGSRAPVSLKVFLTALAILDDLGAVLIIALFYTADLSWPMLGLAAGITAMLFTLNRVGLRRLGPYLILGAALWLVVLRSGLHATVAGVILALAIPCRPSPGRPDDAHSPLHALEHALQPVVAYAIVPIFGFANAGVSLRGLGLDALVAPVTLGVAAGLFLGKQVGVFGGVWLAVRAGLAKKPAGATWQQIYGVALLCGIGFTMSLFIGALAFAPHPEFEAETKLGVLLGSLASSLAGALVLSLAARRMPPEA